MANLTAVLRKTIDGLPNATPQLRAKVYEKARAAIARQIAAANPPLEPHVVETRYRVLEEAILEAEAHYAPPSPAEEPQAGPAPIEDVPVASPEPAELPAPPPPPVEPDPAPAAPPPAPPVRPAPPPFSRANPRPALPGDPVPEPRAAAPASVPFPEAAPEAVPLPLDERPAGRSPEPHPALRAGGAEPAAAPARDEPAEPVAPRSGRREPPAFGEPPVFEPRAGAARPALRPASEPDDAESGSRADAALPGTFAPGIPDADIAAPRVARRREAPRARRRGPPVAALLGGGAILALGLVGWVWSDDIRSALVGGEEVASVAPQATTDGAEPPATVPADGSAETAAPPVGAPQDTAAAASSAAETTPGRQFTQRLLPDGSEVDEGPGTTVSNAFEEGTDVAAASPVAPEPAAAATPVPVAPPPPAETAAAAGAAVPVGQRAVFYEERSAEREGSQLAGNVVWSVVSESPADGQPVEPAIRGVADVTESGLRLTMTIRRNADATLPASHVIELLFETPPNFAGGTIENVQRLALKPTEQARGEPLIGVAGKISDGFFIIALNDLPQATATNLGLLRSEEWIDVPMAYGTGQRALISMEKGIVGDRVFAEALDAWQNRT